MKPKDGSEPVAWMHETEGLSYENSYVGSIPLYANPTRNLSDEEILEAWRGLIETGSFIAKAFSRDVLDKAK